MKTKVIIACLLGNVITLSAQTWGGSTSTTGDTYRSGNVGFGSTTSPAELIHIRSSSDANIRLDGTGASGRPWNIVGSSGTGIVNSGHFGIVDVTSNALRFDIDAAGNVAIGTSIPQRLLHINKIGDAGFRIESSTASTGRKWDFISTSTGPLAIYDASGGGSRLVINNDGNVLIGTTTGSDAQLRVNFNANYSSSDQWGVLSNINQSSPIPGGGAAYKSFIGVEGAASTDYECESSMYGVVGKAFYGQWNYGGDFIAEGTPDCTEGQNIGIHATGFGSSDASKNWAAKFDGETYCTTGAWHSSDRKLKNNIKSYDGALDKIKLLNPRTYTYKSDAEFKNMCLPTQAQIGLIAQELETIFPEFVKVVPELVKYNEKGEKTFYTPSFKAVQYTSLIPVMIAGIKELTMQLDEQKQLVEQLSKKLNLTTAISSTNEATVGFQMSQNIPNPFSNETVIKYTLPQTISQATMIVYDLTGKQITSFPLNKNSSSLTITSEKLSAGIYIYSIVADGQILDSKRMVVADK